VKMEVPDAWIALSETCSAGAKSTHVKVHRGSENVDANATGTQEQRVWSLYVRSDRYRYRCKTLWAAARRHSLTIEALL
jgi:hypothetical protein